MDSVNTRIGQLSAREVASVVTDKTFAAGNLVGFQTGASAYSMGANTPVAQQVRFVDKSSTDLSQRNLDEKRLKEKSQNADIKSREVNINVSDSLSSINDIFSTRGTELAFYVDSATSKQVVTVKDTETGNVIRQIPSEEALRFAERMQEVAVNQTDAVGMLLDRRA